MALCPWTEKNIKCINEKKLYDAKVKHEIAMKTVCFICTIFINKGEKND